MTLRKVINTIGVTFGLMTVPFDAILTIVCGILTIIMVILCIIWAFFTKVPFYKIKETFIYRHSFGIKDLHEFFFLASKVANRIYY